MWQCVDGVRRLTGPAADLLRGILGMMTDQLVAEFREETEPYCYQIESFDHWDCEQRIWLLARAANAFLTDCSPPPRTAIMEATIDAMFIELIDLIEIEIREDHSQPQIKSWRKSLCDAIRSHCPPFEPIDPHQTDLVYWHRHVATLAQWLLGPTTYDKAEAFRDGEIERTKRFLRERGVDEDFLDPIPPLQTLAQTQKSIDEIQALVFQ